MKLVVAAALALQTTPVAPIVKGTALPPPASEEAAVLVPINGLFAAIAKRDGQAALPFVRAEGRITGAGNRPDGSPVVNGRGWADYAGTLKPGPERYEERMPNPAIEVDGDIAMAWGDYVFLVDGKVSHCGVNHFDLVRENGAWKILNVTWSRRTTGCPGK
ncbi:MAG: nuclear transport factor 2 family protein [Sphingomonas sp.]|uniref:nuclear transport factor 2 family protein n=1 Tax=Sphingomonas sp. TaxID=28214 RepID=UPI002274B8A2|nr:nuclear transport factor 2 family protein [Sphingomonas sp.]MCX8474472.1 nuclear transport factor 2 family protein [Sphingomonas sp.]